MTRTRKIAAAAIAALAVAGFSGSGAFADQPPQGQLPNPGQSTNNNNNNQTNNNNNNNNNPPHTAP